MAKNKKTTQRRQKQVKGKKPIPTRSMATTTLDSAKACFRRNHQRWLESRPDGTLGELKAWLEEALDQCAEFDGDEPAISDDLPYPLCDYVAAFTDHESISYREENLEEDLADLDELLDELSETTRLADLPLPAERKRLKQVAT